MKKSKNNNSKLIKVAFGQHGFQLVYSRKYPCSKLINCTLRKVLWQAPENCKIVSVLKTSLPDFVLVGMENIFHVIDSGGLIKEYVSDFPVDGFYFQNQEGAIVKGYIESEINLNEKIIPFELQLEEMKITLDY